MNDTARLTSHLQQFHMLRSWQIFVFALLLCGTVAGCGKSGPARASVSGTVTFDGAPVEEGMIEFIPFPGVVGPPVQIAIKDGKFSSPKDSGPTVGKNNVQITAMKKTGKKVKTIMGEESDEVVQYIPPQYNQLTQLNTEITTGTNNVDFELKKN